MSQQIKLWNIDSNGIPQQFHRTRLDLESRLEEWIEADISLVDDELLIIGRQVTTDFGGIIDLLCIDGNGDLVILELKRDKTPREITAQALDYASWVVDLSHESVTSLAEKYFAQNETFENAFRKRFGSELPDTINTSHRILIVASMIDPSSERIIEYLSRHHGVNINAVTFQYFSSLSHGELLARVFLLEPEEVEYKARSKGGSKRKPNLTHEELLDIASQNGVGPIYEKTVELLTPFFDGSRTTRSSFSFVADFRGSKSAMFNLIPLESTSTEGLKYQVYSLRLAEHLGLDEAGITSLLPPGHVHWKYVDDGPEWSGFTGHLTSPDQLESLFNAVRQHKHVKVSTVP